MLLNQGADINAEGGRYGPALHAASTGGSVQVVQILLDNGADVNAQGEKVGNALHLALDNGHDQVVQMLLDRGADVNTLDEDYGKELCAGVEEGKYSLPEADVRNLTMKYDSDAVLFFLETIMNNDL